MSVLIQLELPEALLNDAQANGLLESGALGELLSLELKRRKAGTDLAGVLAEIRALPGEPLTAVEIEAEIHAARK